MFFKNFAKFDGKHLCRSLSLIKLQAPGLQLYFKKKLRQKCFPINFAKFLRTASWQMTCGPLLLKIIFIRSSKHLTFSCQSTLSHRNQLLCKSMDWFLYNKDLRQERVNSCNSLTHYFALISTYSSSI